jgi:hypothetical protein
VFVEVIEQVIEEDGVGHGEESSPPGVAAVVEQQLRVVHERHAKLTLKVVIFVLKISILFSFLGVKNNLKYVHKIFSPSALW